MANYCGKSCEECTYKEQLNCSGCEHGPGNSWTGTCKLARCCEDKGHKNCTTCGHSANCGLLKSKHMIPKERLNDIAAEEAKNERVAKMAPKLSKWLTILFWTSIVSVIAGLFTDDSMSGVLPTLYYICSMIEICCRILYGAILLIISTESTWYKSAGLIKLVSQFVAVITIILVSITESALFIWLAIANVIISLYGEYTEFKGHEEILEDVDLVLSVKWNQLWKWNLIAYGALIGSILLIFLIPVLGALLTIATAIGMLIISILKLVYLYRTAETFKHMQVYSK